jgi:hypothetical protein
MKTLLLSIAIALLNSAAFGQGTFLYWPYGRTVKITHYEKVYDTNGVFAGMALTFNTKPGKLYAIMESRSMDFNAPMACWVYAQERVWAKGTNMTLNVWKHSDFLLEYWTGVPRDWISYDTSFYQAWEEDQL